MRLKLRTGARGRLEEVECGCYYINKKNSDTSLGGSVDKSVSSTNIDKRLIADTGSIGISSDQSTVNFSLLDGDALKQAIDLSKASTATAYSGLVQLLGFAKDILNYDAKVHGLDKVASPEPVPVPYVQGAGGVDADTVKAALAIGVVVAVGAFAYRRFSKG